MLCLSRRNPGMYRFRVRTNIGELDRDCGELIASKRGEIKQETENAEEMRNCLGRRRLSSWLICGKQSGRSNREKSLLGGEEEPMLVRRVSTFSKRASEIPSRLFLSVPSHQKSRKWRELFACKSRKFAGDSSAHRRNISRLRLITSRVSRRAFHYSSLHHPLFLRRMFSCGMSRADCRTGKNR